MYARVATVVGVCNGDDNTSSFSAILRYYYCILHDFSLMIPRNAGYPDDPAMHGLIAGLWSSLSGLGRFTSRVGSGLLVDCIGFDKTAFIVVGLQVIIVSSVSADLMYYYFYSENALFISYATQ